MKRFTTILALAAVAVLGSCTKLQPSEITSEAYPLTATVKATFKIDTAPLSSGSTVYFDVTDKNTGRTYTVQSEVNGAGEATLEQGCSLLGLSVVAYAQKVIGGEHYYGSASADLSSNTKYYKSITVTLSK